MFYMEREITNRKPSAKVKLPAKKAVLKTAAKANKSVVKKKKPIVSVQKIDAKTKKTKPAASQKIVKQKNQKLKPSALIKKTKPSEVKKRLASSDKSKTKSVKPIVSAKAKSVKSQTSISAKKTKSAVKKSPLRIFADKGKAKLVKTKTIVSVRKSKKTQPEVVSVKKIKQTQPKATTVKKIKKIQPSVLVKKSKSAKTSSSIGVKRAKPKIAKKSRPTITPKSGNGRIAKPFANKIQKSKLPAIIKTKSLKAVSSIKAVRPIEKQGKSKNIKLTSEVPLIKVSEIKIEPMKSPLPVKSKPKKAKPIGSAVFRGKKDRYDFNVFALDENFEAVPAVYIISKRKTDRLKKGHHALICIGETDSISDEIKRHRKGKCVKKHQANVISILPEANEKKRLKIETDLKAAHAVVCNLE